MSECAHVFGDGHDNASDHLCSQCGKPLHEVYYDVCRELEAAKAQVAELTHALVRLEDVASRWTGYPERNPAIMEAHGALAAIRGTETKLECTCYCRHCSGYELLNEQLAITTRELAAAKAQRDAMKRVLEQGTRHHNTTCACDECAILAAIREPETKPECTCDVYLDLNEGVDPNCPKHGRAGKPTP